MVYNIASPGGLVKWQIARPQFPEFLIKYVRGETWEFGFLTFLGDIVASGLIWEPLSLLIEGQDIEANPQAVYNFIHGGSSRGYKFYVKVMETKVSSWKERIALEVELKS